MTDKDPKKIRARIKRYERNFKNPDYRDGGGSRYLMGPLYLLMDDIEGAIAHYEWFDKKFSDDGGEPIHRLSWALAMLRAGKQENAVMRLHRAHTENIYMIPAVIGIPHGQPVGRWGSNWEWKEYIDHAPQEFLSMWRVDEKKWLKSAWDSVEFREFVKIFNQLLVQLEQEPRGPKRSVLVDALYELRYGKRSPRKNMSEIVH
jgi:hypothetical protein